MKAIISCNYEDKYLWCLPLVTWGWNKIGVDVVCFMPDVSLKPQKDADKYFLCQDTILKFGGKESTYWFTSPEHKEATYTQCSRLYGACLDLPEDEMLITSDVDMFMFALPAYSKEDLVVFGSDLVPEKQFPICYNSATVNKWRDAMKINGRTYQQCLDDLLWSIDCENMRGNYWGKDQQELWENTNEIALKVNRAREGTQYPTRRYDRDDAFILDRLSLDTIDYHLNRPGYEPQNFDIILRIMKWHFPNENFDWLINFNEQYKQLL